MHSKFILSGLLVLLIASSPQLLCGQESKKTFPLNGAKRLDIQLERAGLEIVGHNQQNVILEVDGYQPPPERAKGLRPLYNQATDNTGMGVMVESKGGTMYIRKASPHQLYLRLKVPKQLVLKIEELNFYGGTPFKMKDLEGEIEVTSKNAPIHLEQVSGPVIASSTAGSIDVIFSKLNKEKPSAISNVSGRIDVSIDPGTAATFELSTVTGEIYTDLDIDFGDDKDGMKAIGRRNSRGHLNGGGIELTLNAVSSSIYLRKK